MAWSLNLDWAAAAMAGGGASTVPGFPIDDDDDDDDGGAISCDASCDEKLTCTTDPESNCIPPMKHRIATLNSLRFCLIVVLLGSRMLSPAFGERKFPLLPLLRLRVSGKFITGPFILSAEDFFSCLE
jgi:hypothetical protein